MFWGCKFQPSLQSWQGAAVFWELFFCSGDRWRQFPIIILKSELVRIPEFSWFMAWTPNFISHSHGSGTPLPLAHVPAQDRLLSRRLAGTLERGGFSCTGAGSFLGLPFFMALMRISRHWGLVQPWFFQKYLPYTFLFKMVTHSIGHVIESTSPTW